MCQIHCRSAVLQYKNSDKKIISFLKMDEIQSIHLNEQLRWPSYTKSTKLRKKNSSFHRSHCQTLIASKLASKNKPKTLVIKLYFPLLHNPSSLAVFGIFRPHSSFCRAAFVFNIHLTFFIATFFNLTTIHTKGRRIGSFLLPYVPSVFFFVFPRFESWTRGNVARAAPFNRIVSPFLLSILFHSLSLLLMQVRRVERLPIRGNGSFKSFFLLHVLMHCCSRVSLFFLTRLFAFCQLRCFVKGCVSNGG